MAGTQKILISLSEDLLHAIDEAVRIQGGNRSSFIRAAVDRSLKEQHRMRIREQLIQGYQEMSSLSLEWAEIGLEADQRTLQAYEKQLAERE